MGNMNINNIELVGLVLGGLALFIYGIDQLSDGLKNLAGNKIRSYIEKYTSNLFMSILVGTVISAVLHSSTAVTVISISLVRAGLMKLEQAIGITIGANIGTCLTSIMIGLNIEQFAYYIIFVGIVCIVVGKKKIYNYIGRAIFGFGLIFAGLEIMGDQLIMLAGLPWFESTMLLLGKQPWFALLGGTIATIILQSSTAVIGIVQKLYTTGEIASIAGAAFIFGSNVGTTLTAILAGSGGSVSTKRAAWFHAVYNIAGALLGMIILVPFVKLIDIVNNMLNGNPEMWIAQAHFIFNVASTILIIPFVKQSVVLLKLLIPGEDRKSAKIQNIDQLDYDLIERMPAATLAVAKKNTLRMGYNVLENIRLSKTYLVSKDNEDLDQLVEIEEIVNKHDTILSKYLLKIAQEPSLSKSQSKSYSKNFLIIKKLERISDLAVDLGEFYKMLYEEKENFSDEAMADLHKVYDIIEEMLNNSLTLYETSDDKKEMLKIILENERVLRNLQAECRDKHFNRMIENRCNGKVAISIYCDILSTMERIGEHAANIATDAISVSQKHAPVHIEYQALL